MIERKLKINKELEDSIFLFGARQTEKWQTTIISPKTVG